jgi:hypothetical protein
MRIFKMLVFFRFKLDDEEMVFCFQNCSDLLWEKNVLVIDKNSERSEIILKENAF